VDKSTANVLTVNAGSSSVKLALLSRIPGTTNFKTIFRATVSGIGQSEAVLTTQITPDQEMTRQVVAPDQAAAANILLKWLITVIPGRKVDAIGHRIVHGGPNYAKAQLIDDELFEELESFESLDPEHAPFALDLIDTFRTSLPDMPQVACFDTAFFHELPRMAQLIPLPRRLEADGLRRYGFHGLSYSYLQSTFRTMVGDAVNGRVIYAHLGSGASLAATKKGKPIDTTMGFTTASGVPMSTRSGDIDPGIIGFLSARYDMSVEEYQHMINFESGLLGISELSNDMYTLMREESSDERAKEAVTYFVYQVKKAIGALATTLGGIDSLVFSGGIGEQSYVLRKRICDGLDFLGVQLDSARNHQHADLISSPESQVGVHVIQTNEAVEIARQTLQTLINTK
jgi:acetate kinase